MKIGRYTFEGAGIQLRAACDHRGGVGSASGRCEDASYIAGGQSLVPALALRLQAPQTLIDIAHIPELRGIALDGGWLRIGALTRHCEALSDPLIAQYAPLFHDAAAYVAHPAIRNKGTLGGSIVLADPASEFPALAMGAELEIVGRGGVRGVAADDYLSICFRPRSSRANC